MYYNNDLSNSLILFFLLLVPQVMARCICDPADSSCLDNCVNSARDCIEKCDNSDTCFKSCVNLHWPGATFEDSQPDLVAADDAAVTAASTPTSDVVVPVGSAMTGTEPEVIPYLISVFGNAVSDMATTGSMNGPVNPTELSMTIPSGSLSTTHMTITSMVTMTSNATFSSANDSSTSHGIVITSQPWVLSVTGFFLAATTWFLA